MTGHRVTVLALLASTLALALPAAALARFAVSGPAKSPIVRAALGATVPRQCAAVYRSTVDRSWASARFAPQRGWSSRCTRYGSDGVVVLHRTRGRWREITAGSAFTCPIRHVPPAVISDLRIFCR